MLYDCGSVSDMTSQPCMSLRACLFPVLDPLSLPCVIYVLRSPPRSIGSVLSASCAGPAEPPVCDVCAVQFSQESKAGRMLMAKCRALQVCAYQA